MENWQDWLGPRTILLLHRSLVPTGQLRVRFRQRDQIQAGSHSKPHPPTRTLTAPESSFSARLSHKCHMPLCHLTLPNKDWDSNMHRICSGEERQPEGPDFSFSPAVTILTQRALDSCPRRSSTSTLCSQTFQNILHLSLPGKWQETEQRSLPVVCCVSSVRGWVRYS